MPIKLPFFTLMLLISFASVNAVLFTPALPAIVSFFHIDESAAQYTITWFLIGYTVGQLIYGPLANRFGRKPALYVGIILQIISSLLCVLAGGLHQYPLLVVARFMLALGSGVGLKMTFTLISDCYAAEKASQKISYLMLAFAIMPGLGVALGGILNTYYGWTSCFYASAMYGLGLLLLVVRLPETKKIVDLDAFIIKHLLHAYRSQFKNIQLVSGGLLMGCCTSFIYVFSAIAPFIAINLFGMSSAEYGLANILPPIGLIAGSLVGAHLTKKYSLKTVIYSGIVIAMVGTLIMFVAMFMHLATLFSLFLPMIIIYFGLCFILANAAIVALGQVNDKAHGSAVMNFINMGLATIIVLSLGSLPIHTLVLPIIYVILCIAMVVLFKWAHSLGTASLKTI